MFAILVGKYVQSTNRRLGTEIEGSIAFLVSPVRIKLPPIRAIRPKLPAPPESLKLPLILTFLVQALKSMLAPDHTVKSSPMVARSENADAPTTTAFPSLAPMSTERLNVVVSVKYPA